MAGVAAGAAAGLFGDGVLSAVEASAGPSLVVHYPRFSRSKAPLEVVVEWTPEGDERVLWLDRSYIDLFRIEDIRPRPEAVSVDSTRIYYTFRAQEAATRLEIGFTLEPKRAGRFHGRIGAGDGLEVRLRQFAFP